MEGYSDVLMFFTECLIRRTGETSSVTIRSLGLSWEMPISQRTLAEFTVQGKCILQMEFHRLTSLESCILGKTQNRHRITASVGIYEGKYQPSHVTKAFSQ
jgi:hypothetical protein